MTQIPAEMYARIVGCLPIPCVDLVITDQEKNVLLVRRTNDPARGEWWFPGGRVNFWEYRKEAAIRKLAEECGLSAAVAREIGTYDLLFELPNARLHSITTVYHVVVAAGEVELDDQSIAFDWKAFDSWFAEPIHPFIREALTAVRNVTA